MGFDPLPVDYGNSDVGLYSDQLVQTRQTSTYQNTNQRNNQQLNSRRGRGSRGGRGSNNR